MSVNSAVLQIATGTGAWIGGLMLTTSPAGHITGYGLNGWVSCACIVFAMWWVSKVQSRGEIPVPAASARAA